MVIGRGFAGVVLAVVAIAGCSLLSGPVVRIDEAVSPRLTPAQVADIAIGRIHEMEQVAGRAAKPARVLNITATTPAGVPRLEPRAGQGGAAVPGVLWLVRAEGTFTNSRTPPGAEPMVATSGYLVISDADGGILGLGFP